MFDGNLTEKKAKELSQTAMELVSWPLENSECIGYEPRAKSGPRYPVDMDSDLFYKGLLFCQVIPSS